MTQSATVNSRSRRACVLDAFDYDSNGALDKVQVEALITADFVGRGENLVLIGGSGTGKTAIASAALEAAEERGLSSQYISGPTGYTAAWGLVDLGPSYIGSKQSRQGLRDDLLNCDVLVIDEAEKWLEACPALVVLLIGRRIELGKTNILIITSSGWKRFVDSHHVGVFNSFASAMAAEVLNSEGGKHSAWARIFCNAQFASPPQLLLEMGIDIQLPGDDSNAERLSKQVSRVSSPSPSPFEKAPVWHIVYTGENNYWQVRRRRYA